MLNLFQHPERLPKWTLKRVQGDRLYIVSVYFRRTSAHIGR